MKDFYSSMNQTSEHMNQDSSLRGNKTSNQQEDLTLEQQKSNSWTPAGPTKNRASNPSQLTPAPSLTLRPDPPACKTILKRHPLKIVTVKNLQICTTIDRHTVSGSRYSIACLLIDICISFDIWYQFGIQYLDRHNKIILIGILYVDRQWCLTTYDSFMAVFLNLTTVYFFKCQSQISIIQLFEEIFLIQ